MLCFCGSLGRESDLKERGDRETKGFIKPGHPSPPILNWHLHSLAQHVYTYVTLTHCSTRPVKCCPLPSVLLVRLHGMSALMGTVASSAIDWRNSLPSCYISLHWLWPAMLPSYVLFGLYLHPGSLLRMTFVPVWTFR